VEIAWGYDGGTLFQRKSLSFKERERNAGGNQISAAANNIDGPTFQLFPASKEEECDYQGPLISWWY
jgi:hypothetical protein